MSNFVKLDTGILNSSVWIERDLRSVFITALLMARPFELKQATAQIQVRSLENTGWEVPAGWYGLVEAAGVGILRRDGIENVEEGLTTLERLCAPDADSRSREFDGRRMARINGGYLVLNYFSYRERDYRTEEGKANCYVYYAQDGDVVKIGMSKNPWARIADLRVSRPAVAIVATERGSFDLETQRHHEFKEDCVGGEWYRLSEPLKAHLEQLRRSQEAPTVATRVAKGVATGVATKKQKQKTEIKETNTYAFMGKIRPIWQKAYGGEIPVGSAKLLLPAATELGEDELARRFMIYCEATSGQFASVKRFATTIGTWGTPQQNGSHRVDQNVKRGYV